MPRDRYAVGNTFLQSFMAGYGFVDNIQARKREERRLEEELTLRRERQAKMDAIVFENQRFNREDRQRLAQFRERGREAAAIMANPNPNLDVLGKDYSDIPGVLDFVRGERERIQTRGHFDTAMSGDPSFQARVAEAATAEQEAAQQAPAGGQPGTMQVRASDPTMGVEPTLPAQNALTRPGVGELQIRDMTVDQINQAVANGTMTEEVAREQMALRKSDDWIQSSNAYERAMQTRIRDAREKKLAGARDEVANANRIAESFTDMSDTSGQTYRDWSPLQATQWYHQNRNNIDDPAVLERMDKMMMPRIQSSLEASRAIMDDANIDVGSNEFRNAQRQFSLGMGLAMEVTGNRDPAAIAGVDNRNLSRRDNTRMEATIQAAGEGRPTPLPGSPNRHRADMAVAMRGNNTVRVGKPYQNAAYGLLTRGVIDINIYGAMLRTGAPLGDILAAQGIDQQIIQGDPTKDTRMITTNPDGSKTIEILIPARRIPTAQELEDQYRNTFGGDAVKHLYNNIAPTYNTDDDPDRGKRTVNTFLADISQHEATARAEGYSLHNLNDVAQLYQRWADFHVVRDVYNRELSGGWFNKPTFTQQYGQINENIFSRGIDEQLREVVMEEDLTTSGGNPLRLTPLKDVGGAEIQYLRQQFPAETRNLTDDQIAEFVRADDRSLAGG